MSLSPLSFGRLLWPLVLAGAVLPALAQSSLPRRPPEAFPPLRMSVPEAREPVRLLRQDVRIEVAGRVARTRVELVVHNPNARVLEGELQFPLRPGQTVSGFALDIEGELRPAVPVEKARGREVFEDVTRQRIDPALLEQTGGNQYRLRLYPLPARGERRVVLETVETLAAGRDGQARLVLPPGPEAGVPELSVEVLLRGVRAQQVRQHGVLRLQAAPVEGETATRLGFAGRTKAGAAALDLGFPLSDAPVSSTQLWDGETYVYAELPVGDARAPRPAPRVLGLLWDASGSAAQRDRAREFALLDAYFRALRQVEVQLVVARDRAEPPRRFVVRDGDWSTLREALEAAPADGATAASALAVPAGVDLALVFSDGLVTLQDGPLPAPGVPLYALSAVASVDSARLRRWAESAGGEWLDLTRLDARQAAEALRSTRRRLLALQAEGLRDALAASPYVEGGRLRLAGVRSGAAVRLALDWLEPDGRRRRQEIGLALPARAPAEGIAAQAWAQMRIDALQADAEGQRAAIRRLGQAFRLASPETSLIVLDRVEDYVRHDIVPPASLRAAYEAAQVQRTEERRRSAQQQLEALQRDFAAYVQWWEKDFPRDPPPVPKPLPERTGRAEGARADRGTAPARAALAAPPPAMAPAPAVQRMADSAPALSKAAAPGDTATASIALQPWNADAPYLRRLRAARPGEFYRIYLDERPGQARSTAFFLDVAGLLFDAGQRELGLRVLSNLAEMELENRQVLRLLGDRLVQAGEAQRALPVLRQVLRLAPDEPQSWRDLGLALAEAGDTQAAIEHLWQAATLPSARNFGDLPLIALTELNALVVRAREAGAPPDTRAIPASLLRPLPLDLRVALSWDMDDTDIDLWIVDPHGEITNFSHPLSRQGGRISRDVVSGYGPEVYSLRRALPGRYVVKVHFYGHRRQVLAGATSVMLRLSTGFSRPSQQDRRTTMRLERAGDGIEVGSFEVPAAEKPAP